MGIRNAILGLLAVEPRSGYALKKEFEHLTADVWQVNDGQIYTTVDRLKRDGLVVDDDTAEGKYFTLTEDGWTEFRAWASEPRPPMKPERDELIIKVALLLEYPHLVEAGSLRTLVHTQRIDATAALQGVTRQIARLKPNEAAQASVLDASAARIEAELRWLDAVEARIAQVGDQKNDKR